eukprot:COSAG01_NODE_3332_length_6235_cov_3.027678_10_plen_102_part_00
MRLVSPLIAVAAAAAAPLIMLREASAVRVWVLPPQPRAHPLNNRSYTPGAGYEIFTPIRGRRLPGWAALRLKDTDLDNLSQAWQQIDKYPLCPDIRKHAPR